MALAVLPFISRPALVAESDSLALAVLEGVHSRATLLRCTLAVDKLGSTAANLLALTVDDALIGFASWLGWHNADAFARRYELETFAANLSAHDRWEWHALAVDEAFIG